MPSDDDPSSGNPVSPGSARVVPVEMMRVLHQRRWNALGFYFVSFLVPIVAHKYLKASGTEMALLFSLQTVGSMLSAPIAGRMADNVSSRRFMILLGSSGRGLSYLFLYCAILARSFPLAVASTFSLGFFVAFFWNPIDCLISESTASSSRAEAFGIASQQDGVGGLVGACVAFALMALGQWLSLPALEFASLPLFAFANVYAGYRILQLVPLVRRTESASKATAGGGGLLRNPSIPLLTLTLLLSIFFLENVRSELVNPFLQPFLMSTLNLDEYELALIYIPGAVVSLLLGPRLGHLGDVLSARILTAGSALLWALLTWLLISVSHVYQLVVIRVLSQIFFTMAGFVVTKFLSEVSQGRRGTTFGLRSFLNQSGSVCGTWMGGLLWQQGGLRQPFRASIAVSVVLSLVYYGVFSMLERRLFVSRVKPPTRIAGASGAE